MSDTLYVDHVVHTVTEYIDNVCGASGTSGVDIMEWKDVLIENIMTSLCDIEERPDIQPLTGAIDFAAAKQAFRRIHKQVVITRVDKAANCLSIMCKACYVRVAEAELNGPEYTKVNGESLEAIMDTIVLRQKQFLKEEHLPIPRKYTKIPGQDKTVLKCTIK